KRQRTTGMGQRLRHSAREQARLAEVSQPHRVARHDSGPGANVDRSLEQGDSPFDLAEARVSAAEVGGDGRKPVVEVVAPAELESALEQRNRVARLPAADI